MKKKIKEIILLFLISLSIVFPFSSIVLAENTTVNKDKIVSLYCWEIENFNLSKLKDEVEFLGINTLYIQSPGTNIKNIERLRQIMSFAKIYNIDVFLLDGYYSWFSSEDGFEEAKGLVDQAVEINKTLDYKIKGVSYDVEFYSADEYQGGNLKTQREMFETYIDYNHKAIEYAKENNLAYSAAMPVWFDKLDRNTVGEDLTNLRKLMNDDYDHIVFMNYARSSMAYNLDDEVLIAKEYGINIVNAVELQSTDYVSKNETFDVPSEGLGLLSAVDALKTLQEKYKADPYNYNSLGLSYHYYTPIVRLMERDTKSKIESRYELEVTPLIEGNSVLVDEAVINGEDKTFEPIHGYYSGSPKYVLNFYGLEYGKEYTLTVKKGNKTATKSFVYERSELNKLEIAYLDILLEDNVEDDKKEEEPPKEDPKEDDEKNPPTGDDEEEDVTPPGKDEDEVTPPSEDKDEEEEKPPVDDEEDITPPEKDEEEVTPPSEDKDEEEEKPPVNDEEDITPPEKDDDEITPPSNEKDEDKEKNPNEDEKNYPPQIVEVPDTGNNGIITYVIGGFVITIGGVFVGYQNKKYND